MSCRKHCYYKFPGIWVVGYFWFEFSFFFFPFSNEPCCSFFSYFRFLFKWCHFIAILMAVIRLLCLCLQLTKSIIGMSSPAIQMLTTCPCLAMFGVYGHQKLAGVGRCGVGMESLWSRAAQGVWWGSHLTVWGVKYFNMTTLTGVRLCHATEVGVCTSASLLSCLCCATLSCG